MTQKSGTVKVLVTLQSIGNGMLMNPMTEKTLDELQTGVRNKIDKTLSKEMIAEGRIIKDKQGKVGIPIEYLLGCLKEAGRSVKNGKKQISTADTTTIFSFLDFGEQSFLRFKDHSEMVVDRRKGNMKNGGKTTAIAVIRPKFEKWSIQLEAEITIEGDFAVAEDVAKQLFVVAGSQVGLGDFRPAKRGPFGRFKVADWKNLN
jgi:hypothetical protein